MFKVSGSAGRWPASLTLFTKKEAKLFLLQPPFAVANKRVDLATTLSDEEGVRGKQVRDRGEDLVPLLFSNSVLGLPYERT